MNAYYNPPFNEIVFPAGILQPPQFDPTADDAVNYGAIGMVIGHELTHGFDDEGRKFDADGNLKDWWTEEDAQEVQGARRRGGRRSTTATSAVDTLHVNGKLTLGENIADLGGLTHRLRRLPALARAASRAAGDRRLHGGAALLPGLRPGVAPQAAPRGAAAADAHRPALAGVLAGERAGLEHAGVREGLRLQGRRRDGAGREVRAEIW